MTTANNYDKTWLFQQQLEPTHTELFRESVKFEIPTLIYHQITRQGDDGLVVASSHIDGQYTSKLLIAADIMIRYHDHPLIQVMTAQILHIYQSQIADPRP